MASTTHMLYRCDHCQHESLVRAEAHRPRMCPQTNCNGTQSPVVTTDDQQRLGWRAGPGAPTPPDPSDHVWRCFHCDEVFTDHGSAREHFGEYVDSTPACKLAESEGGLVQRIRDLERALDEALAEVSSYENDARLWHDAEADRVRRIGHVQWWQGLDSKQGEILVLQEEVARLKAGKFTADEIHDICHDLHGTVDAQGFADGCAIEQQRLYGCAPDRDRVARLRGVLQRALVFMDHAPGCGTRRREDLLSPACTCGLMEVATAMDAERRGPRVHELRCTACGVSITPEAWTGACPGCGNGTMREMTS